MITVAQDDRINPQRLPFEARVASWSVSYHKTEAAAERRAKREAAIAARHCGGPAPQWQVNRVALPEEEPHRTPTAALLRRCRQALSLSAEGLAQALRVSSGRTVRRWEAAGRDVPGPVWVALGYMLRAANFHELAAETDHQP